MIGTLFLGPPIPPVFSFAGINPVTIFIERIKVVSDPFGRTTLEILSVELLGLFFFMVGIYFFVRYLFIVLLLAVLLAVAAKLNLKAIITNDKSNLYLEEYTVLHFEMISVLFMIIKVLVSKFAFVLIIWSQLTLTCFAWLSVYCYTNGPVFIGITTSTAFLGGCGLATLLIKMFTDARLISLNILNVKREQFSGSFYRKWSNKKYISSKWRSLQPLPIYCGSQFVFSKHALINYVDVLNTNVTNAVLLIPTT